VSATHSDNTDLGQFVVAAVGRFLVAVDRKGEALGDVSILRLPVRRPWEKEKA
jgi:hypothetical protein